MAMPNKPGQSYLGMYHLIVTNRVQMYKEALGFWDQWNEESG